MYGSPDDPGDGRAGGSSATRTVRSWMEPEQPERPGAVGGQVPHRPGEDRGDGGPGITAGVQRPQPVLMIGQLGGEVGE